MSRVPFGIFPAGVGDHIRRSGNSLKGMHLHYIPMCQAFDFNFITSLLDKSELSTLSTSKSCVIISSEITSVKINMAAI